MSDQAEVSNMLAHLNVQPVWLYRCMPDEDGTPYDHGVVQAETFEQALDLVRERLRRLFATDEDGEDDEDSEMAHVLRSGIQMWMYPLLPASSSVWQDDHARNTNQTYVISYPP